QRTQRTTDSARVFTRTKLPRTLQSRAPGDSQLGPGLSDRPLANLVQFRRVRRLLARRHQLLLGDGQIELRSRYGPIGQHRDNVVRDLNKSAVDVVTAGRRARANPHLAIAEPADHRAVARRNADLAVVEGQGDEFAVLLQ